MPQPQPVTAPYAEDTVTAVAYAIYRVDHPDADEQSAAAEVPVYREDALAALDEVARLGLLRPAFPGLYDGPPKLRLVQGGRT
jgi:hypothetical protein